MHNCIFSRKTFRNFPILNFIQHFRFEFFFGICFVLLFCWNGLALNLLSFCSMVQVHVCLLIGTRCCFYTSEALNNVERKTIGILGACEYLSTVSECMFSSFIRMYYWKEKIAISHFSFITIIFRTNQMVVIHVLLLSDAKEDIVLRFIFLLI